MIVSADANQKWLNRITEIVLANLENQNFGVNELAVELGMSQTSLLRKLKTINKKTVNQIIREIRLQKAMVMIHNEDLTISEIAYRVGFSSPTYFNKCFHEYYGYSPGKVIEVESVKADSEVVLPVSGQNEKTGNAKRSSLNSWLGILFFVFILVTGGNALYQKFHVSERTDSLLSSDGRIAIAVMPFYNMTQDSTWDIWQEGVQECLISSLANTRELKIRNKESINALINTGGITDHAALTPEIAGRISQKLDANFFISGSLKQAGSILRIDAQLTNTKTNEVVKFFKTERPFLENYVFQCVDTISEAIKNFLLISKLRKDYPVYQHYNHPSTNSAEAFRYFIYGNQAAAKYENERAISWYLKALEVDSNYFDPMKGLSSAYAHEGNMEKDYQWVLRYYKKRNLFNFEDQLWASWAYAFSFEPPEESIKYLRQLQQMDDQSPNTYYLIGITYNKMKQYKKAIPELEKNLQICRRWGKDFMQNNSAYAELGLAYHQTGQYKKEKRIYKEAEKYIPDDPLNCCRQAILALTEKDTAASNRYFEKYMVTHRQRYPTWESEIPLTRGWIYSEAGYPDKAEEYIRKSISMDPDNPTRLYILANFLIDNNRKLEDIQGLMDHAMSLAASKIDYYIYLDTKGWGLYKQGKCAEALEILEKTWNSAPFPLYSIYSHLETVRKSSGINHRM